jgi:uncharacterized membrane protein
MCSIALTMAAVLGTAALTVVVYGDPNIGRYLHVLPAVFAFLVLIGLYDLVQEKHSILRNLKFPRFRGHRNICVSGVRNVEETPPIPA